MPSGSLHQCHPLLILLADSELRNKGLGDRARPSDVVQQTLLQALDKHDQFKGTTEKEGRAWLIAIMKNEVKQILRQELAAKRDRRRELSLSEQVELQPATGPGERPSQQAMGHETEAILKETLDTLSAKEQKIIQLRVFQEKEFSEMAIILEAKELAVRRRYERALKRWYTAYREKSGQ
jgi:RNA polymerase sigma factor (sigma-70 family)